MKKYILLPFLVFAFYNSYSQVNYTANDQVVEYNGTFRAGSNLGAYSNWTDQQLADIAAGNPALNIKGAGVKTFRPTLPEIFLEAFGYDIRRDAFDHYASLGLEDNTVFIGYSSLEHRDPVEYCPGIQSASFENLYDPIWDGGANGTPYNDDNYYARYIHKMVTEYKDHVKFWEIWNEPDFDYSGCAWKDPGMEGNWWENVPEPCDYQLRIPIYHYIRILRISYEVIKTVDPTAYVAIGGLGYPSFLDLVLRHTDNPDGGSVSSDFPLNGGAYFDVMSFHSYPHIDGSLRYWSNSAGGFVYERHSDAAVQGVLGLKNEFKNVLDDYGYNGSTYPEKKYIVTESNIPRKQFSDYIGSQHAQRNFLMKALIKCQQNDILQYHVYNLAEGETFDAANNEFQTMGLYQKLEGQQPYEQTPLEAAIAYKTASDLLFNKTFDSEKTAELNLPTNIDGGAFVDNNGSYTYVLWAKSSVDQTEQAFANYNFPATFGNPNLERFKWDHSQNENTVVISSLNIELNTSPIFLIPSNQMVNTNDLSPNLAFQISPNPAKDYLRLNIENTTEKIEEIAIYNSLGQKVLTKYSKELNVSDGREILLDINLLKNGHYFIKIFNKNGFSMKGFQKISD